MGRGGTPAREISIVSLVAYGPNSDSASEPWGVTASETRQGGSQQYAGVHSSHLLLYVLRWRGKANWIKTEGVCSMRFKVPTHTEKIGDPFDKYSINRDISPN